MNQYLREEQKLWKKGYEYIVCVDEAGRGPLAGPVTVCAVIVLANSKPQIREIRGKLVKIREVRDSKKLSPKKREEFYKILTAIPEIRWAAASVSEKIIDKINILEATKLAMKRAVKKLEKKMRQKADFLVLDGNFKIKMKIPQKPIIKADEKVFSCVAASIIAKVVRDRKMLRYHKKYPQYSFDKHKGYPTKLHRAMLKKYGPCVIHRKSFKPVSQSFNHS